MHILHCVDAQDMAGAGRAPEIALMSGKTQVQGVVVV